MTYVGHGFTDDQGHLSLLVRRSRRGLEAETGIKAPDLARTLRLAAPQQRRSVILDCCFSEAAARAFIGMATDVNQQVAATAAKDLGDDQPARGTLLLCSSPVGEISMGAPNAERTLFTGAVLDVLRRGAERRSPFLSFADLRDAAFDRMVVSFGVNAPRPALHQVNAAHGDLTRLPAFPNRAPGDAVAAPPPESRPEPAPSRLEPSVAPSAQPEAVMLPTPTPTPLATRAPSSGPRLRWLLVPGTCIVGLMIWLIVASSDRAPRIPTPVPRPAIPTQPQPAEITARAKQRQAAGDDREAARLYRLAADQGDASAQVNLGRLYEQGRGWGDEGLS